jgi:K+-transporting ATPase A subunit
VADSWTQNSATPFENPTGLTNFLSIYLLFLAIPFALTYTFGKMVGSIKQGFTLLLAAMLLIFGDLCRLHHQRRARAEPCGCGGRYSLNGG